MDSSSPAQTRSGAGERYTISEVAALTGLSAYTLRWYERIKLLPHVDRSHTGQRRFTTSDLQWLAFVGKLRLTGMPVADMVRFAELTREGEHTVRERRELLMRTRKDVQDRIDELQGTLAVLDYKIDFYGGALRGPDGCATGFPGDPAAFPGDPGARRLSAAPAAPDHADDKD